MRVLYKNEPDYNNLQDQPKEKGKCMGIVKDVHIEILHSSVGSFDNPQTKIVGVLHKFGKLSDETFSCIGLACNHRSNTQRLDFSVSVSFTDISSPASHKFAAIPVLQAKFPHDFFYPFVSSSSLGVINPSQVLHNLVVLVTVYTIMFSF